MLFIGLDIGGSKIEGVLAAWNDGQGWEVAGKSMRLQELAKKRVPTNRNGGYERFLQTLKEVVFALLGERGLGEVQGIGLALPGPVAPESGRLLSGNSLFLVGKDLVTDLGALLSYPSSQIVPANDAQCFTLAEACLGHSEYDSLLGVILGTGVGGGFYVHGNLLLGRRGGACEWGHITLHSPGLACYCGSFGCAEQYLSGPALEGAMARRMYAGMWEQPSVPRLLEYFQQGDPLATALVQEYKNNLARFCGILTQTFDPGAIVFGGGLSLAAPLFSGLDDLFASHLFIKQDPPALLKHSVGDAAGALGAVLLLI